MKFVFFVFALFACGLHAKGQEHLPDATLDRDFAAQVKSMDEFAARFNGDETKPELLSDSTISRRNNIISLFDFDMSHENLTNDDFKNLLSDFVNEAISWEGKLSITNENAYAEAICKMKYSKKECHITLLMKRETNARGDNKWAIAGVKGLSELGLYSDKRVTISPVDHETHFMSLQDFFQANRKITPAMRSNSKEIDELSFFLGLCVAKGIEFIQVDELKFHFMDVPNYVFVVEEIGRIGTNSGWLITQLKKMNDSEKKQYKITLFGEKP